MFTGWQRFNSRIPTLAARSHNQFSQGINQLQGGALALRMMSSGFNIKKNPRNRMLYFKNENQDIYSQYKRPKTIQEMKKLQSFVKKKVSEPGESLTSSILTQAKRDESFNDFLKEFKAKHEKDWANIIDLTKEKKEDLLINKTLDERKDELVMLEEFRRRKNVANFRETLHQKRVDVGLDDGTTLPRYEPDKYLPKKRSPGPPSRFFAPEGNEIFDPTKFTLLFMETDSVTLVTRLNRINSRRVLVFCGNGEGIISYGKGKGLDYQAAFQKAFIELKKNLICIDLDHFQTLTAPLYARFNDFRLWLYPRASPNYWGSMQMMHMLIQTGIYHVRFIIKSRKNDRYSMIYTFFKCVTAIKKPTDFAKVTGQKLTSITYHSPLGASMITPMVHEYAANQRPR
ncbi:unnamed protein product [Moneuplotes crassus]|uniref:S5 DRBM domain-containing protein n=1 Tax=Euplotes crassus TaxID=5936 RepID=A0AAD1XGD5_EUPCR|nr:unnamed protein product [Moneuplotes crassus]